MGLSGVLRRKSGCEPFTEHHMGKTPSAARAFPLSHTEWPRLPVAVCSANVAFFLLTVTCFEIATGPHGRRAESCPDISRFWMY